MPFISYPKPSFIRKRLPRKAKKRFKKILLEITIERAESILAEQAKLQQQ